MNDATTPFPRLSRKRCAPRYLANRDFSTHWSQLALSIDKTGTTTKQCSDVNYAKPSLSLLFFFLAAKVLAYLLRHPLYLNKTPCFTAPNKTMEELLTFVHRVRSLTRKQSEIHLYGDIYIGWLHDSVTTHNVKVLFESFSVFLKKCTYLTKPIGSHRKSLTIAKL